jgi:ATP phosphoribosyltransferase
MRKIEIALPKGKRLLPPAYDVFKRAGYKSTALEQKIAADEWKQLEFESDCGKVQFLVLRADDIPLYVDKSWVDLGAAGFDDFREYELSVQTSVGGIRGDNFISDLLPDLKLCPISRFCVAGLPEKRAFYETCKTSDEKILTVATMYPYIAQSFFAQKRITADILTITGSTELAPKHGGVDVIFDIVETGSALRENGLVIFEEAMPIQTKILASKAALKYDPNISKIIKELEYAINSN